MVHALLAPPWPFTSKKTASAGCGASAAEAGQFVASARCARSADPDARRSPREATTRPAGRRRIAGGAHRCASYDQLAAVWPAGPPPSRARRGIRHHSTGASAAERSKPGQTRNPFSFAHSASHRSIPAIPVDPDEPVGDCEYSTGGAACWIRVSERPERDAASERPPKNRIRTKLPDADRRPLTAQPPAPSS